MFRLTILASAMAAVAVAHASDSSAPYIASAQKPVSAVELKQKSRDISDLYFVHFSSEPLAVAASKLPQNSIQSMYDRTGGLNVSSAASQQYLNQLQQERNLARTQISKSLGRNIEFENQYGTVLNAATMRMSVEEAQKLQAHSSVSMVEKVTMHQLHTDAGPEFIGANQIWQGVGDEMPTKGEGIVVGIIDTGIDADHPSFAAVASDGYEHINPLGEGQYLGDCLTHDWLCNDKLIGVVSWEEIRGYYPSEPVAGFERPEIIETGWDMQGHGTHVASTVAGNPIENVPLYNAIGDEANYRVERISGVAPRANIVSYQVCLPAMDNASGGCFPDLTVLAIEHAIENGVNVLNYSVGGGQSSPWETSDSLAFLNARLAGIHVATSAGNSGPSPQTIGSPGNSPWITTVAAYTHDRGYSDKQIIDFAGGDTELANLDGRGATASYSGTIVDAKDFGDGDCLEPFAEGTFDGEIVLCRRGDIARVEKGANVKAGGAGGMVLVNVDEEANNVVADPHSLPAIQLNVEDGAMLIDWLASGEGHTATIEASEQIKDPDLGDIAGDFTSRGPNFPYAELLAPDVAGPGVDIYAAHTTEYPFSAAVPAEYSFMSGTSMSSPHVAGALALIYAMRPDWTPAQAQSALMTTANSITFTDDDNDGIKTPSTPYDAGAGSIRVADAVKAMLLMDISEQEYMDANPEEGGDPRALNLPSMVAIDCVSDCRWTRTVTAVEAGSWSTSVEAALPGMTLSVTPAAFELASGESQELTITASVGDDLAQTFNYGKVMMHAEGGPTQHLTVAVEFSAGNVPQPEPDTRGPIIMAEGDTGRHTMEGFSTLKTDALQVQKFGLTQVERIIAETTGDLDTSNPVSDYANLHSTPVTVYANTKMLSAWIRQADAPDLDLYIVRDSDLNGKPSQVEIINASCISGREDSQESCVIEDPLPGSYLVVVHNFAGTEEGALDTHEVAIGKLRDDEGNFEVITPDSVELGEAFSVDIEWDQQMQAGDIYYGAFVMGTSPDSPENIGLVQFELHRALTPLEVAVEATDVVDNAPISYSLTVAANTSGVERAVTVTTQLPEGYAVDSADGAEVDGARVTWAITQAAGAEASEFSFVVVADTLTMDDELALIFDYAAQDSDSERVTAETVTVLITPVAMINGSAAHSQEVQTPASFTLSAEASTGSALSYKWTMVSGPESLVVTGGDTMRLEIESPELASDEIAVFELMATGSNALVSEVATATITLKAQDAQPVEPPKQDSGSSGSFGWVTLLLLAAGLRRRA